MISFLSIDVCLADSQLYWPFAVERSMSPTPMEPGIMNLRLSIVPTLPEMAYDSCSIEVVETYNLSYTGPSSMVSAISKEKPAIFNITVIIPANDTSGIELRLTGGEIPQFVETFWVSDADTVKVYPGDPRLSYNALYPPSEKGYIAFSKPRQLSQEEKRMEKMRKLEEKPFKKSGTQYFHIGDKAYSRNQGEYKFKEVIWDKHLDKKAVSEANPELFAKGKTEYVLDLRDTLRLNMTEQLADSIVPIYKAGFYRAYFSPDDHIQMKEWIEEIKSTDTDTVITPETEIKDIPDNK
ncbi:MAG: hypothetical protein GY841_03885 [FCB group bacterium]|nr:hypothetical protein [FCB group bacterium]